MHPSRPSQRPSDNFNPLRLPVTTGVAGLCSMVTLLWWTDRFAIEPLVVTPATFWAEPWRLLTSSLVHGNILHLLFNLYWFFLFGSFLERRWGPTPLFFLLALLAAAPGAAEFALFRGGIGMSGAVYGLFGLLWALGRRDRRYADAVDSTTSALFVGWFFFCVAATIADVMQIANVAHAGGAILGASIGAAIGSKGTERWIWSTGASIFTAACLLAASIGRPFVNLAV